MVRWSSSCVVGILALATASIAPAATPILNSNGQLTGAVGVNVNGSLYDVEFVDGACSAFFSGCDASSDFTFQTQATAEAAAQALLHQVFIDRPSGAFDTNVALTYGCAANAYDRCNAGIPYFSDGSVLALAFADNHGGSGDGVFSGSTSIPYDSSSLPATTLARFTALNGALPEPASWAIMLLGFGAIGVHLRRPRREVRIAKPQLDQAF